MPTSFTISLKWLVRVTGVGGGGYNLGLWLFENGGEMGPLKTTRYLISYGANEIILKENNSLYTLENCIGWPVPLLRGHQPSTQSMVWGPAALVSLDS